MSVIVTLTTDFGLMDPYVAMMKAVILNYKASSQLIDVSHLISPQNIYHGHFMLAHTWRFFPKGSVHLVVVDPDVGTKRKRLCIQYAGHVFVGPDNGLFSFIPADEAEIREINPKHFNPGFSVMHSTTFEGRDIFAHAVGNYLLDGIDSPVFPVPVGDIKRLEISKPSNEGDMLVGEVLFFDHFGNIVTNIQRECNALLSIHEIRIKGKVISDVVSSYAEKKHVNLVALWNSYGLLEVARPMGSAQEVLDVHAGDRVYVKDTSIKERERE